MSSHADTIRRVILSRVVSYAPEKPEALAALDALLAEHQRYKKALERIGQETTTTIGGKRDYMQVPSPAAVIAREALAGDAE